jgi:repressor of nif and glnA expression
LRARRFGKHLENKGENYETRTIIFTIQKYQMKEAEVRRRLAVQTELSADLG